MTRKEYEKAYRDKVAALTRLCDGDSNLDFWEEFEKTATQEEIIGQWLVDEGDNALMYYRKWCFPDGIDLEAEDLRHLGELHKNIQFRKKIEELLNDCNFHEEAGLLSERDYEAFEKLIKDKFSQKEKGNITRKEYEKAYRDKVASITHLCDGDSNLDFWEEFEKTATDEEIIGQWLVDEGDNALMSYRKWCMPDGIDFEAIPQEYLQFDSIFASFCKDKVVNKYLGIAKRMKAHGRDKEYILDRANEWYNNCETVDEMVGYQLYLIRQGIEELYKVA